MESIIAVVQQWVSSGSLGLAAGGAFAGGVLAGLCPCVIVMVPLLIGFIGGMGEMTTKRSFLFTLVFVLGFSLELALLFTVGLAAAPFLQSSYMTYLVAAICVLLGLALHGSGKNPHWQNQFQATRAHGLLGAAVSGLYVRLHFYAVHRTDTTPAGERHPGHESRGRRHNDTVLRAGSVPSDPSRRDLRRRGEAGDDITAVQHRGTLCLRKSAGSF